MRRSRPVPGEASARRAALAIAGRTVVRHVGTAAVAIALVAAMSAAEVAAHEQRDVGGGQYSMTVGFIEEPAYVGLENGLFFRVTSLTGDRAPVEGLDATLTAEVTFGDQTKELSLAAVPDDPGVYHGSFIPTRAGDYTFRVAGQIGDQSIDESFRSSPDTFDAVQPAAVAQFPEPVPAGVELADELEQAQDDATGAQTFATVALVVGAAGLVFGLGAIAMSMRRRPA